MDKHHPNPTDYDVLKVIHRKIEQACKKAKDGNPDYLEDMAEVTEMCKDFWDEKRLDHKSYL